MDSRILTQKETYDQKIIFDCELQSSEPGQNGCRLRRDMESHLGVSKLKKILVIREMAAKNENRQRCSEMLNLCPPLGTPTLDSFPV